MNMLKVGDKVRWNGSEESQSWQAFLKYAQQNNMSDVRVTSISSSGEWLSVNYYTMRLGFLCDPYPFKSSNFERVEEEADEMPEVNQDVLYFENYIWEDQPQNCRQILRVSIDKEMGIQQEFLEIAVGNLEGSRMELFSIDPDQALDLANDLIRMAMHLKRKSTE